MNKNMLIILGLTIVVISIFAFTSGRITPAFVIDNDNFFHALGFVVISFMIHHSIAHGNLDKTIVYAMAFGGLIELFQVTFTQREFSLSDWAFDALGINLYFIVYYYFGEQIHRFEQFIMHFKFKKK